MSKRFPLIETGSEPSDVETLRAIAEGNRRALATLYDRYATTMLTLAQRFLGSRTNAEDLVHDLFIEVWQRASSYDVQRGSVRTWLLLRTRSRALDRLRSVGWRQSVSSEHVDAPKVVDGLAGPDDALAQRATEAEMRSAVRILNPEERGLIGLIYVQGYSLEEAAGHLEKPLGTVKSRLSRVLGKLRRSMNQPVGEV